MLNTSQRKWFQKTMMGFKVSWRPRDVRRNRQFQKTMMGFKALRKNLDGESVAGFRKQ